MHLRELTYFFKVFSLHSEGRLFGFLLLSFFVALLESLSLLVLLPVLELVNIGGNEKFESPRVVERIKDFFDYFDFSLTLWSATLVLFFIIMAKNILVFIASCWKAWMKTQMSVKIKNNLIHDLNKVSHRHFQKKSSGFYVSLATVQIDRFLKSFMQFCSILVTAISLVLYVSLSFIVEWKLAAVACLFGLLSLVLFSKIGVFVRQKAAVFSDTSNLFSSTVIQIIQSFKYSVSTNTTGKLELGLSRVISKLEKASFKIGVANSLAKSIQEPLALVGIVGALF